jgi:hypothetical protein
MFYAGALRPAVFTLFWAACVLCAVTGQEELPPRRATVERPPPPPKRTGNYASKNAGATRKKKRSDSSNSSKRKGKCHKGRPAASAPQPANQERPFEEEKPAVAPNESDSERRQRQAIFGDEVISDESRRSAIAVYFVDTLDGPCRKDWGGDDGAISQIRAKFGEKVCPRGSRDVIRRVLEDCEYCAQRRFVLNFSMGARCYSY